MRTYILPALLFVLIFLVWFFVPEMVAYLTGGDNTTTAENYQRWGQYGDMYGMINSLFSGLTVAGLVLTIYLQQRQTALMIEQNKISSSQYLTPRFEDELERLVERFMNQDPLARISSSIKHFQRSSLFMTDQRNFFDNGKTFSDQEIITKDYYQGYNNLREALDDYMMNVTELKVFLKHYRKAFITEADKESIDMKVDSEIAYHLRSILQKEGGSIIPTLRNGKIEFQSLNESELSNHRKWFTDNGFNKLITL